MKKAMALLLVFALSAFLAACGTAENHHSTEPISTTVSQEPAVAVDPLDNAVYLCQFVKDCLGEPDSFQIHSISHIEKEGQHYYSLDFSHMIKNKEMERTCYFAEFDGSTLLCIVNENSAIHYQTEGDYRQKYAALSAMFQEENSQMLDTEWISSQLT